MFPSKFQLLLTHFNYMEGTKAKCELMYMLNFVVSGLSEDEFGRLSMVYKYNPDRFTGTDVISLDTYLKMRRVNTKRQIPTTTTDFSIEGDGVDVSALRVSKITAKPSSEPAYTEMLICNVDADILGIMSGHITHGKTYDIMGYDGALYKIINDRGNTDTYHHSWFTPVKLYDEDETKLTCRDIEFEEGDCIDLRKHTPDQIRQIAEHYWVYELEGVLSESEDWRYLVCDGEKFDTWSGIGDYTSDGGRIHL